MDYGKYIVLKDGYTPILFPCHLTHSDVAKGFGGPENVHSAGFFEVGAKPDRDDLDNISVSVFGKSTSLGKEVNKDDDSFFIKKLLRKQNVF